MAPRTLGLLASLGLLAAAVTWLLLANAPPPPPPPDPATTEATARTSATTPTEASAGELTTTTPAPADASPTEAATASERQHAPDTSAPTLLVRVLDPDREPIAGAVVTLTQTKATVRPSATTATTRADGRCTLPLPAPAGDQVQLHVAAGERHSQANWQRRPEVTVTLPWTGALRGRLVDAETERPVADAVFRRPHTSCMGCEPDTCRTASDGSFELAAVPRDQDCTFVAAADGYPEQTFRLRLPGRGEPIGHTFRLRPGVFVLGRCIDHETKAPIAGATVSRSQKELGTTAADGSFRVLALPPENPAAPLRLDLAASGYCHASFRVAVAPAEQELPLLRSMAIAGHVTTADGTGIAKAQVYFHLQEEPRLEGLPAETRVANESSGATQTDAAGSFRLAGLVPGGKGMVRASHPDYDRPDDARRLGASVTVATDTPPITLHLVPKPPLGPVGTVVGTLTIDGTPDVGWVQWQGATRKGHARSGPTGTFRLEKVEAGSVELTVVPQAFQGVPKEVYERLAARRRIDVAAGAETVADLTYARNAAPVTGRVAHDDGEPAVGHGVYVVGLRLMATTDANGCYELPVPAAYGPVDVLATGQQQQRRAEPGATGIDFVVPKRGVLRYRARRADGRTDGIQIAYGRTGSAPLQPIWNQTAPDPDGFREQSLARGTYTVIAQAGDAESVVQQVVVDATGTFDATLASGTTVTLALAADGPPLPDGVRVRLREAALHDAGITDPATMWWLGGASRSVVVTAAGAELRGIGRGRHALLATDKTIELVPDHVEVGTEPVTVRLAWRKKP